MPAAAPGPDALGRGVVVGDRDGIPPWAAAWPEFVVDDAVIAEPAAPADQVHDLWARRTPFVVVLTGDAAALKRPERRDSEPHDLDPSFTFERERLQYLVWSNNYDARSGEVIWWHGRRAAKLGAAEGGDADVLLPDGVPAWCDGGPRGPLETGDGAVVVHRDTIELGRLAATSAVDPDESALAPDQLAAVAHGAGPARIIAPAGSGKTRVLTARLRHLLTGLGYEPETVTAVAYNTRARDELAERTEGLGAHLRTLNSLALAIVNGTGGFASTGARRDVLEERDVRRIVESLVELRHARNTDPVAPYIEALGAVRLGLRPPAEVEADFGGDAEGLAQLFPKYRAVLQRRSALDFDEQIYAAIEVLLRDPVARTVAQGRCRHLLVDEFQDLTPAHLLLVRLLAGPAADVFGVGDDDQTIYSYAGADPRFLIDYRASFPGAAEHALEVNYRCPAPVVQAADRLLRRNRTRVAKRIVAAKTSSSGATSGEANGDGLGFALVDAGSAVDATVDVLRGWHDDGRPWPAMAVLTRVNSILLPVQVALGEAGIPRQTPVDAAVLDRTGVRTALAYLRIAVDPGRISADDVTLTVNRPSRRVGRNVVTMLTNRGTSLGDVRRLSAKLDGNDGLRLEHYGDDIELLVAAARTGDVANVFRAVRDEIGLGGAIEKLDRSRREADRSTHGDDLLALEQVAHLHPDPGGFEEWLRDALSRPADPHGVHLSTVHRVKGREWPAVVVHAVDAGLFPHRLATDVEEERRVFHVAVTRAIDDCVVVADKAGASPFVRELVTDPADDPRPATPSRSPAGHSGADRDPGQRTEGDPVLEALKAWRRETASTITKPAYTILHDAHLQEIAAAKPRDLKALARCKGMGPTKLERWGEEILAVVALTAG